jgi:hypothetical protein
MLGFGLAVRLCCDGSSELICLRVPLVLLAPNVELLQSSCSGIEILECVGECRDYFRRLVNLCPGCEDCGECIVGDGLRKILV